MKKIALILWIWGSLLAAKAQNTLPEYLTTAGENHPELRAAFANYQSALETVLPAGALPDPELTFGYFISPLETRLGPRNFNVTISQMFPWMGTLSAQKQQAGANAEAAYFAYLSQKQALFYEVKTHFFTLYEQNKRIQYLEDFIENLDFYEKVSEQNLGSGRSNTAMLLEVRLQQRKARRTLENLQQTFKQGERNFLRLIGDTTITEVALPDTMVIAKVDADSLQPDWSQQPLWQQKQQQMLAAEQAEQLAKLSGRPNIGVGLDYGLIGQRTDMEVAENGRDVWMPMLSLSLPINRRKYRALAQKEAYQKEVFALEQEAVELEVANAVEARRVELNNLAGEIADLKQNAADLQEIIRLSEQELSSSKIGTELLLRRERDYIDNLMEMEVKMATYHIYLANIQQLLGTL